MIWTVKTETHKYEINELTLNEWYSPSELYILIQPTSFPSQKNMKTNEKQEVIFVNELQSLWTNEENLSFFIDMQQIYMRAFITYWVWW